MERLRAVRTGDTPCFNITAGENPGQWPRLPRHAPVARSVVMRLRSPSRGSKGGPAQHNLLITTTCSLPHSALVIAVDPSTGLYRAAVDPRVRCHAGAF